MPDRTPRYAVRAEAWREDSLEEAQAPPRWSLRPTAEAQRWRATAPRVEARPAVPPRVDGPWQSALAS